MAGGIVAIIVYAAVAACGLGLFVAIARDAMRPDGPTSDHVYGEVIELPAAAQMGARGEAQKGQRPVLTGHDRTHDGGESK